VNGCYGLTSLQNRRSWETTQQIAAGGNWNIGDRLSVKAQGNYTWSHDQVIAFIPDAQYNFASPTSGLTVTMNPNNSGGVYVDQPGDPQMSPNTYLDQ